MKDHLLPVSDIKKRAPSPKSLSRRLQRQYHALPQLLRNLILAVSTVIAVATTFRLYQNQRDIALKRTPSDFSALAKAQPKALWPPPNPIRHQNGTHIDERYIFMRHLGGGFEGSASLYVDVTSGEIVVVKTYMSVLRNIIPDSLATVFEGYGPNWPTEIEASLLLGHRQGIDGPAYVPVRDYFVLKEQSDAWSWALVTPFIEAGTLENLAKSTKIHERTPQKLDKIFRSVFEVMLRNVELLHASGYCHDDIKPDNIFITDTTHWLLGDLGNVRTFAHPWHSTGKIKREYQLADCKLNDVSRLVKTYMSFLRQASGDAYGFDEAFWKGEQVWSRFYWRWMGQPVDVDATLELSRQMNSSQETEWKSESDGGSACLSRKTDMELMATSLHWRLRDYWPLRRC